MSIQDPLVLLQRAVAKGSNRPALILEDGSHTEAIDSAVSVRLSDDDSLPLNIETRVIRDDKPIDLRTVIFAYINKDLSSADYIQACAAKALTHLTFVERTELLSYINGTAEDSQLASIVPLNNAKRSADGTQEGQVKRGRSDAVTKIYAQEHVTKPFSFCLHGSKEVDFSSVQREARETFLISKTSRFSASLAAPGAKKDKPKNRLRDPIILLSPSASSLITMHNVKKFLEDGVFVPPEVAAKETGGPAPELLSLAYKSKLQTGKTLRFVVVENTDKFKPDYWDRLLVVFTTGQAWQFKPYAQSFSDPRSLFHKTKGVLVRYRDEPTNQAERDWNIQGIQVDRQSRYNDRVTVSALWDSIERWMEEKGKKDFYRYERRT
ncbi:protein of unknown function [Taphrina deformans PYCC 5710]|uniref:Cell division control protein 73 C-terminal domain-containing protein n=1 Tax=Taphrina deformans (strain PYCC 5710 / ATCC 11124 / CBS 356.35 / IMI 108563 / JCM 9778 / NBRC 8474) TaxID=1097556 RepID=R4XLP7_TAPDE|nr:protein of unknown function [Taphrina deformans PYCC 5710]|eukprot:CCG84220.1 protein of unknown function [Taphrina deformans PYCC 5710]